MHTLVRIAENVVVRKRAVDDPSTDCELMTSIERVRIDSEEYGLGRSEHRRLYERYRDRIDTTASAGN